MSQRHITADNDKALKAAKLIEDVDQFITVHYSNRTLAPDVSKTKFQARKKSVLVHCDNIRSVAGPFFGYMLQSLGNYAGNSRQFSTSVKVGLLSLGELGRLQAGRAATMPRVAALSAFRHLTLPRGEAQTNLLLGRRGGTTLVKATPFSFEAKANLTIRRVANVGLNFLRG